MNSHQHNLYWFEWKQCRAWLMSHGRDSKKADEMRAKLTREALGYDLSMTEWSKWKNAELDKVLAKFRSVSDSGNLNAQLKPEEDLLMRKVKLRDRCFKAVSNWVSGNDEEHSADLQQRYLDGVARRVCQAHFHQLDERGLQKVCHVVELQAKRHREKLEAENPF